MSVTEGNFPTGDDTAFAGIEHETLPSAALDFSCKTENSPSQPEVVVDVKQGDGWVRIPTTKVEQWVNKDGPADMSRTAKVKFPFEWGGQSIIQYVNGFQSQNNIGDEQGDPYDECRVFFYDRQIEEWVITHYGYVGGVGPANENGVGKMWVYDPADLMKGIQVSKNWGEPTLSTVVNFALYGEDNNGRDVGLFERSVFSQPPNPVSILGQGDIPTKKQEDVREENTQGFAITGELPIIGSFRLPVPGLIGDIFGWVEDNIVEPLLGGQKRFQINRHNMVDYMDWLTSLIDARWWFEPSDVGPVLVIDATAFKSGAEKGNYTRRYFVDEEATDYWGGVQTRARWESAAEEYDRRPSNDEVAETVRPDLERENYPEGFEFDPDEVPNDYLPPHNYDVFSTTKTLNNSALIDIKPFNTLRLYGESTTFRERVKQGVTDDGNSESYKSAGSPGLYTEEYPFVEVQYPKLVDRADGYEYSAQPVESDKIYLDEAESEAVKTFKDHLAEETEGSMEIEGEPHIMPYDYHVALPACNGIYDNMDAQPISWEVNGVKHVAEAGERYTTQLGVSISVDDRLINVESEYKDA